MTIAVADALAFIETHGVVLASAKGSAPRLIDVIAGEPIAGNWWSHPRANEIYRVLSSASDSESVLVCRLVRGKLTLVHRRLWPALVRLADRFAPEQLAEVRNEHTASGRHVGHEVPFPDWVPSDIVKAAKALPEAEAAAALAPWLNPAAPLAGRRAASR
jgi:hypothetical protein